MTRRLRITVGDRYARAGNPPHARLRAEDGPLYDEVLVGVSALTDPTAWRRLD